MGTILKTKPLNRLSTLEFLQLEIDARMQELRASCNRIRLSGHTYLEWNKEHLRYLIGGIHGAYFALGSIIIQKEFFNYDEYEEILSRIENEINFLTGSYQYETL